MANLVLDAVARTAATLKERLASGKITQAQLDNTNQELDFGFEEYTTLQTLKSAYMGTKLTTEEAQTIYNYLGEGGPDKFNKQPIEVKFVLSKLLAELLGERIKAA